MLGLEQKKALEDFRAITDCGNVGLAVKFARVSQNSWDSMVCAEEVSQSNAMIGTVAIA